MNNTQLNKADLSNIKIGDVIDIALLQRFQDNFAEGMDIASVTVDVNGAEVTKPSSYVSMCANFTHTTTVGIIAALNHTKKVGKKQQEQGDLMFLNAMQDL